MKTKILIGDCIESMKSLPTGSVSTCITSPPYYGLRRYCDEGSEEKVHEIGLEQTPDEYVQKLVEVFREVKRVLRDDGTCWVNLGDSYNGSVGAGGDYGVGGLKEGQPKYPGRKIATLKPKDLIGIPWRVAFALQADGWYLRQDIIWAKRNPMPESVTDRCTKSHEYVFLLTKSARYWYDAEAIKEKTGKECSAAEYQRIKQAGTWQSGGLSNYAGALKTQPRVTSPTGRNKRSVWTVSTQSYSGAHFATFPPKLIEPMILAGCPAKCCPVCGAGWVRVVEKTGGRDWRNDRMKAKGIPGELNGDGAYKRGQSMEPLNNIKESKTIGFQPSCQCNATDTVPGTVLDPFGGSGTTAYVANAYGRNAILCELNPAYEPMIRERLGMAYEVEQEERKPEQMELFK